MPKVTKGSTGAVNSAKKKNAGAKPATAKPSVKRPAVAAKSVKKVAVAKSATAAAPRTAVAPKPTAHPFVLEENVRLRAYEIFLSGKNNSAIEDWLEAEAEAFFNASL